MSAAAAMRHPEQAALQAPLRSAARNARPQPSGPRGQRAL